MVFRWWIFCCQIKASHDITNYELSKKLLIRLEWNIVLSSFEFSRASKAHGIF